MIIQVDHKLRIRLDELPVAVRNLIEDALSIPNVMRQKAMEQNLYGWQQMPESIPLWRHYEGCLEMPRGFLTSLLSGLDEYSLDYELEDNTTFKAKFRIGRQIDLKRWQIPAVEAMYERRQGIYKSPAGSGKTVSILALVRRLACQSIVVVNTKDIMHQWVNRARSFLGDNYPVGLIGDGYFEVSPYLTIAMAQTLHSRYDKLEAEGFFDEFGFFCLDECHHSTADTYNRIANRFTSRYRLGVSATPDKTGDFALAINVLGPIIHETPRKDVDALIDPEIHKVSTDFSFRYRGARGRIPSNYPDLLKALISDEERNALIVRKILEYIDGHSLVLSKRIEHLETLSTMLGEAGYPHPRLMFIGSRSPEERREIVETAAARPSVTFSTLADEAVDIPRLDRLFLVFPQRNAGLITQQVGRVARVHPSKRDAIVFDFCDPLVGPLDAQWKVRRTKVYLANGYRIRVHEDSFR